MGSSSTRAKNKYNQKNYDRFILNLPKGEKERYKNIAKQSDMSLSSYIIEAVEEKIKKDKEIVQ
ncbi:MAG: Arc family DNA-binding protein [Lachnospiraceae bacterium]|nr:Arc family DNA-binding protein [Bacteroides fragilis]MCM1218976.1 Arc family DNA-binding protein [Lachnospiraceae bacterium]